MYKYYSFFLIFIFDITMLVQYSMSLEECPLYDPQKKNNYFYITVWYHCQMLYSIDSNYNPFWKLFHNHDCEISINQTTTVQGFQRKCTIQMVGYNCNCPIGHEKVLPCGLIDFEYYNCDPTSFFCINSENNLLKDACKQCTPSLTHTYIEKSTCAYECNTGLYLKNTSIGCVECPFNTARKQSPNTPQHCFNSTSFNDTTVTANAPESCCETCTKPSDANLKKCPVGTYYKFDNTCSEENITCIPCTNLQNKTSNTSVYSRDGIESADYTRENSCYTYTWTGDACGVRGMYPKEFIVENGQWKAVCEQCTSKQNEYILPYDPKGTSIQEQYCKTKNCLTVCPTNYYNLNCRVGIDFFLTPDPLCFWCIQANYTVSESTITLWIDKSTISNCSQINCSNEYYIQRIETPNFVRITRILTCTKCRKNLCIHQYGKYQVCDGNQITDNLCLDCPQNQKPNVLGAMWAISKNDIFGITACQWQCSINYYKIGETCQSCAYAIPIHGTISNMILACPPGKYIKADCLIKHGDDIGPHYADCTNSFPYAKFAYFGSQEVNNPQGCLVICNDTNYMQLNHTTCIPRNITSCPKNGTYMRMGTYNTEHTCEECPKHNGWNSMTTSFGKNCEILCSPGYYSFQSSSFSITLQAECTRCPDGKYKQNTGSEPCTPCPPNQYQSSMDVPQKCIEAPENSFISEDKSKYTCNQGFQLILLPLARCSQCTYQIEYIENIQYFNNIQYEENTCDFTNVTCKQGYRLTFQPTPEQYVFTSQIPFCTPCWKTPNAFHQKFEINSCNTEELMCHYGFYRTSTMTCNPCPLFNNSKNISTSNLILEQEFNNSILKICGLKPMAICTDIQDEINLACTISSGNCNNGFFVKTTLYKSLKTNTSLCEPCANKTTCKYGEYFQLCNSNLNENTNLCKACSKTLTRGQVWSSTNASNNCDFGCTYGYYMSSNLNDCIPCSPGFYQPIYISKVIYNCTRCPSGYISQLFTSSSSCSACPPGSYKPLVNDSDQNTCIACYQGKYSNEYASISCKTCSSGFYNDIEKATSCKKCDPTTPYSSEQKISCTAPPLSLCNMYLGFYEANNNNTTVCNMCTAGLFCNNNTAYLCPSYSKNKSSNLLSNSESNCTATNICTRKNTINTIQKCPNHTTTYGIKGSPQSIWCHPQPGYYGYPGQEASQCPRNFYCPYQQQTTNPIPCPKNFSFSPPQSTSLLNCTEMMHSPCDKGYFKPHDSLICKECMEGSYCPGNDAIYSCDNSYHWYSNPKATAETDCFHKILSDPSSTTCPTNTLFKFEDIHPLDSVLKCRAINGYYFIPLFHTQGLECPSNYFCPKESTMPIPCSTQLEPCNHTQGLIQNRNICPPNSHQPLPPCIQCPSYFNTYFPRFNDCSVCCNSITHTLKSTQENTITCVSLQDTTYCPQGFYMETPLENSNCLFTTQLCKQCNSFNATDTKIYRFLEFNERNTLIFNQVLSKYGNESCTLACQPGYYKSLIGECVACPAGKYSYESRHDLFYDSCKDCDQGTYAANAGSSSCKSCGKWSIPAHDEKCLDCKLANQDRSLCLKCDKWKLPSGGRSNCTCVQGTYTQVSQDPDTLLINYTCKECPTGSISSSQNPFACTFCEAGNVCNLNSAISHLCPVGHFKASLLSTCAPCLPGYYSNELNSSQCKLCNAGTYASEKAMTECTKCPQNTFSKVIGAISNSTCQKCNDGNYDIIIESDSGSSQCVCPEHYFLFPTSNKCVKCTECHPNATNTMPCAKGSFQDTSICVCKDGFTGDGYSSCKECPDPSKCTCSKSLFNKKIN